MFNKYLILAFVKYLDISSAVFKNFIFTCINVHFNCVPKKMLKYVFIHKNRVYKTISNYFCSFKILISCNCIDLLIEISFVHLTNYLLQNVFRNTLVFGKKVLVKKYIEI